MRDQRIASLQINPIHYNSATKQLKIFKSVTFRIDFNSSPQSAVGFRQQSGSLSANRQERKSPAFESLFQGTLRNYEQAKPWRSPRQMLYGNHAPGAPTLTTSTFRFKIPVTRTDLYRITYNNIKATGIEPEDIDLETLRLESSGQKQGIYVFDENGNDALDPNEQMVFYGRALADNKFTDENVYWLRFALKGEPNVGLEGSRVEERDATPVTQNLIAPTAFLARARFEENVHHDVLSGTEIKSELADHYFWVAFRGGNIETSRKDLPIEVPLAVPRLAIDRSATLRLKFQGASRRGNALHLARISFNGLQLGRIEQWKRQGSQIATRSIPHARVHNNQVNFMRIEALDKNHTPAGSYDFYLDWYEFDYWRSFQAAATALSSIRILNPVTVAKSITTSETSFTMKLMCIKLTRTALRVDSRGVRSRVLVPVIKSSLRIPSINIHAISSSVALAIEASTPLFQRRQRRYAILPTKQTMSSLRIGTSLKTFNRSSNFGVLKA